MKYVRVVVAVEDDQLDRLADYLSCFIETDEIPSEFVVDPANTSNPIQGAYSTAAYDTREDALGIDWAEEGAPSIPVEAIGELATMILEASSEEDVLDHCRLIEHLAVVVPVRFLGALCDALELCPIHHCDAAICVRINVNLRLLPGVQTERVEVPLPRPKGDGLTTDVHREAVFLHDKFVGEIRYLARRREHETDYGWVPVGGRSRTLSTKAEAIDRLFVMKGIGEGLAT